MGHEMRDIPKEAAMQLVSNVTKVFALDIDSPVPSFPDLYVAAVGEVPTTGWSNFLLLPRIYITPPEDGIWDFEFVGSPPGVGATVIMPALATYIGQSPSWLKGVRVQAANNALEEATGRSVAAEAILPIAELKSLDAQGARFEKVIAVYDDSFQPIGLCHGFHIKMKKLRHQLTLTVTGPDEAKIRSCVSQAIGAGTLAALIAAFSTGGLGAAHAFFAAAIASLEGCLASGYKVRFDDKSHWIEWCT
jgi:hypothetical protein